MCILLNWGNEWSHDSILILTYKILRLPVSHSCGIIINICTAPQWMLVLLLLNYDDSIVLCECYCWIMMTILRSWNTIVRLWWQYCTQTQRRMQNSHQCTFFTSTYCPNSRIQHEHTDPTSPPPHTHTSCIYHGSGTEEKVFKKRKLFKEDLKEFTEVERWSETRSWFQLTGAW